MTAPAVLVDSLEVRYRGRPTSVLKDFSLRIETGTSFGIVGESGSGKSTLARVLTGLMRPSGGLVAYHGVPLDPRGRLFGGAAPMPAQIVFQDPQSSLHPGRPLWQLITEPLEVAGERDKLVLRAKAADLAKEVGLGEELLGRRPHELSGGQRQRVAIARALASQPDVLILDEPTSALDVSVQARVLNLLLRLRRERSLTYILISHNVGVVRHMCDQVAVIQSGVIVEQGTASKVLETPEHPYTIKLLEASRTPVEGGNHV